MNSYTQAYFGSGHVGRSGQARSCPQQPTSNRQSIQQSRSAYIRLSVPTLSSAGKTETEDASFASFIVIEASAREQSIRVPTFVPFLFFVLSFLHNPYTRTAAVDGLRQSRSRSCYDQLFLET